MDNFIIYILKACLGITLFVVPYFFLLRNDNALQLKRFFLLGGVFASFLFPFLVLKRPAVVEIYSPVVSFEPDYVMSPMEAIPVEVATGIEIQWPTVLLALYLCGLLILLFRNVFMLLKWNAVWKKAERKGTGVAYSGNDEIFAMFSRIFLPDRLQNTKDIDSILLHEKAHIRQMHFIDLIIAEAAMLLTWFNPFTWLLTVMVKENHEHLADRMVLEEGIDPVEYRTQLLNQTMGIQVFSLALPFNRSSVKHRFDMMKQSKSIRSGMLKVAVLVPLILISLGMAVGKVRQGDTVSGKIVFSDTGEPAHGASVVIKNTTIGTVADEEGSYQLELKERAEVVFSFVGYKSRSYWFNPGEYRFVVLEREVINLIPPVIMIDGVKSDYSSPDEINPDIIASIRSFDRFGKEGGTDMYMITTKKGKDAKLNRSDLRDSETMGARPEGLDAIPGTEPIRFNGKYPWTGSLREYLMANMTDAENIFGKLYENNIEIFFRIESDGKIKNLSSRGLNGLGILSQDEFRELGQKVTRVIQLSGLWSPREINGEPQATDITLGRNFWLPAGKSSQDNQTGSSTEPKSKKDTILKDEEVFYVVEEMPKFNNGDPAIEFRKHVAQNLRYPKEEAAKGNSGLVVIQFVVNADGSVSDAEVVRGASPGLNSEAIRVVESSPLWTPGKQRGKTVAVKFTFPVTFTLSEPKASVPGTRQSTGNGTQFYQTIPERKEIVPGSRPVEENVFYIVEEMPIFNNGDPAIEFRKYISENLRYPKEEAEKGISGRVIVQFKVAPDGSVKDAKVVVGASPGLDNEALRVVELSPAWTPGKQKGEAVNVLFTFPVNFVLQEMDRTMASPQVAREFLILVETHKGMIKLTGLKGCAWKELSFTPTFNGTLPYVDQNGVSLGPQTRKSMLPPVSQFGFQVKKEGKNIELKAIHGTNWKDLSFSWKRGECRQLINQDGMVSGR